MLLSNIRTVHYDIFSLCKNLVFVDLRAAKSLKHLEDMTFYGLKTLKSMLLGDNLETIGASAFEGSGLKSFTAPASLKKIRDLAFCNCENLKRVDLSACTL